MNELLRFLGLLAFAVGLVLTGAGNEARAYPERYGDVKGAFCEVVYSGFYRKEGHLLMLVGGGSFLVSLLIRQRRSVR